MTSKVESTSSITPKSRVFLFGSGWQTAAVFFQLAADSVWIAVLLKALFPLPVTLFGLVVFCFGVACTTQLASRFFQKKELSKGKRTLLFIPLILALLLLAYPLILYPGDKNPFFDVLSRPFVGFLSSYETSTDLLVLMGLLLIVRRSVALSSVSLESEQALKGFQIGSLIFLVCGTMLGWLPLSVNLVAFYSFFLLSLFTLTFTRIDMVSQLRGGRLPLVSFRWLAFLIISVFVVVVLILLGGSFTSITLKPVFEIVLQYLYWLAIILIALISIPFILLFAGIVSWIAGQFSNALTSEYKGLADSIIQQINDFSQNNMTELLGYLNGTITIFLSVVMIIVIVSILAGLRRRRLKQRIAQEEDGSPSAAMQKRNNPVTRWIRGFLPKNLHDQLSNLRIRQIYAGMLKLSAALGHPRPPARTPFEFLLTLEKVFPDFQVEIHLITNAYSKIRYGEFLETEEEYHQVAIAWEKIQQYGKVRVKELKHLNRKIKP
jgi:hypothetical protein